MYFIMNQSLPDQHTTNSTTYFRNEWVFRLFATPFFAFFVPNITPLVYPQIDTTGSLVINYAYFTMVVHLLWVGNRWIVFNLRKSSYWIKRPVIKSVSILSIHFIFSFVLALLLHSAWNNLIAAIPVPVNNLLLASFIAAILSIMIATLYEIVLLTRERRMDLLKTEKLGNAKIQAELDTMKSQIDPHFIFNSLNTLAVLISDDKEKALLFNENLAKVYRYILSNRANDLVTVKEEVDFINSYFFLLRIRFEDSLTISLKVDNLDLSRYYMPTIAIQTAIENAIKHNQFSCAHPLLISIELNRDYAIIANNKNPVKYKAASSGVGLINLDNRYKLIMNKSIHIDETPGSFILYLPLVKK
jgi:two-component system, LytTR family, sensor kinase